MEPVEAAHLWRAVNKYGLSSYSHRTNQSACSELRLQLPHTAMFSPKLQNVVLPLRDLYPCLPQFTIYLAL
jgi:hypothetical protein